MVTEIQDLLIKRPARAAFRVYGRAARTVFVGCNREPKTLGVESTTLGLAVPYISLTCTQKAHKLMNPSTLTRSHGISPKS